MEGSGSKDLLLLHFAGRRTRETLRFESLVFARAKSPWLSPRRAPIMGSSF